MCNHKKWTEYCRDCDYRFKTLKNYSHTRDLKFTAKPRNKLYFGIEIEIEIRSGIGRDEVFDILYKEIDDTWEMKHDGSLDYGIEFESQPLTLSQVLYSGNEKADEVGHVKLSWMKKIKNLVRADDQKSTGLHIHVNRDALPRRIGRVNYFVNKHHFELEFLSNRVGDNWKTYAAFQPPKFVAKKNKYPHDNRYMALNLTRPDTIEFRFFQSTTKQAQVRKYVCLVAAICEYVPHISKKDLEEGRGWQMFLEKIATSGKKLSTWKLYLIPFLKEKGLWDNSLNGLL